MSRALEIAQNGCGVTAPNPMVGAIIVHNDKIIGEGYTSAFGGPHAEVKAIASVANKALLKSATLYVTLEPCSHFGKTPPCVDLILKEGLPSVMIGLSDPHEKVAGKGIEKLQKAGVEVVTRILEAECREHHKRFLTFHEKNRPYIILKWAETSDGFIAPDAKQRKLNPEPFWISNAYSRQLTHLWRSEEQAVLVGTNTVLEDNPKLDVRHWTGKNPTRIVLDRNLRIPKDYHVLDGSVYTLVLTEIEMASDGGNDRDDGNDGNDGKEIDYKIIDFSRNLPREICRILHEHQILSVIIEGGTQTLESFIAADLWDEARVFEGISSFKKGIKAPAISGKVIDIKPIGSDRLSILLNS